MPRCRETTVKEHVGDRSILIFQIARCAARPVVRKAADKGGDNRREVCSVPPRNAFIPYVRSGMETANTKTANRQNGNGIGAMARASGCHSSLHVVLDSFWPRFSHSIVLRPVSIAGPPLESFRRLLCQFLIQTATGTSDRSELKPRVRGCENVNYHVWPEDK